MGCNQMIIQTQTIINMLKELAEATNLNIDKELDEIYNFFLIYEKDKQGELNLEQLKKELKAKAIHLKLNGKKVETVKNLRYSKRRKVYILNFLNGGKKELKKLEVLFDIEGVSIVELLRKFNIT
jgi:hypothetical protein